MGTTRIVRLEATNIMRIKAVRITPDGAVIRITGRNGAGKSSVLNSIVMALGGKDTIPQKPVRDGSKSGQIILDLGDLLVTRRWTKGGDNTYLEVKEKDGKALTSPQRVLDQFTSALTFDPLEFMRMDDRKQAEVLRGLAGLDFGALNLEREGLYDQRRDVNRDVRTMQARIASMPKPEGDVPESEMDVSALEAECDRAVDRNQEVARSQIGIDSLEQTINELENSIVSVQRRLDESRTAWEKATKHRGSLGAAVDLSDMRTRISHARAQNAVFSQAKAHMAEVFILDEAERNSERLTDKINEIDETKQTMLAEAKLPVDGLSFDETGVYYRDIPIKQASSAEQLTVSVEIGFVQKPDFPVMMIHDGSLLDSESLAMLEQIAEKHDGQLWIEMVSDGDGPGIIIEDGEVVTD